MGGGQSEGGQRGKTEWGSVRGDRGGQRQKGGLP